jgi:hypothetical protein
MKSVQPIATSLVLSIAASVLASWLLRHTVFLAQSAEGEPTGGNIVSPVVVVPIVFVGNTLGTQVTVPRRGLARLAGSRRRQRR